MSIDVNVQNDLVIVTESSEDITVNVSNAAGVPGPAGVGVPVGGATGEVLKKFSNTNYDTYWAADASGLTSVGLSMPTAFTVSNTPLTSNGTIAVSGAGTAAQYIRGDGQLATFPSTSSGGSSVNYYLNGSINASVAGYKQLANTATIGGGTDFTLVGNGLIAQFLTDAGNPNRLEIPGGAWNFEMYFQVSSSGGSQKFYVELLKYNGTTFTSIASSSTVPEEITGGTSVDLYLTSLAVPTTSLLVTDRLAIRVYIVDNSGGRTVTLHTEDNTLCEIITTFAGGISALNGLTANTQYLATGTSGTDFAISSLSDTHTFNLPTASATNRGALSSADWSAFNGKVGGSGVTGQVSYWNGTNSQTGSNNLFWDAANSRLGIGTNAPLVRTHIVYSDNNYMNGVYVQNTNNGVQAYTGLGLQDSSGNVVAGFQYVPNTFTNVNLRNTVLFASTSLSKLGFVANTGSISSVAQDIYFSTLGNNNTYQLLIKGNTGNLLINSNSDGGQRLQVYGDAFIKGSGATSATNALLVQNSSSQQIFLIRNDGATIFGGPNVGTYLTTDKGQSITTGAGGMFLGYFATGDLGYVAVPSVTIGRPTNRLLNATSGTQIMGSVVGNYSPTSGTGQFITLEVVPTINQTGGANGITRGLYVNPTLTAAADWRSIEWSNNSGWGLYGNGTARNFLGGDLLFGNNKGFVLSQSGTNKSISVLASEIVDNFAGLSIYPSQGTNVGNAINIIPRGTGYNSGIKSQIVVFNTDFVADNVNYEFSQFRAAGTAFTLTTGKAGTGTIRPFLLSSGYSDGITNPNQLWLYASGRVGINTTSESTFTLDVNGTARVSGNTEIKGSVATSASNALTVQNSSGTNILTVRNDKTVTIIGLTVTGARTDFPLNVHGGMSITATSTSGDGLYLYQGGTNLSLSISGGGNYSSLGTMLLGSTGTINASAFLQINSTAKGFLPPRMTTTEKTNIASPAAGLMVFDTTLAKLCVYSGTAWETITSI